MKDIMNILIWGLLIATLILGMIDDIEHQSNRHRLLWKIPLIAGFIFLFKNHKHLQWIIWGVATIYPIVLYTTIQRDRYSPPLFDHVLPAIPALLLLIVKSFLI